MIEKEIRADVILGRLFFFDALFKSSTESSWMVMDLCTEFISPHTAEQGQL